MKITKKMLDDYPKIIRSLGLLKKELEEMRTSDAGIGHSVIINYKDGFPKPQAVVGFDGKKYNRKRKQYDRLEQQAAAVRDWIDAIEDPTARAVFRMYYIDDLDWSEVAKQIGYRGNPDYPRICIRDKYLRDMHIK